MQTESRYSALAIKHLDPMPGRSFPSPRIRTFAWARSCRLAVPGGKRHPPASHCRRDTSRGSFLKAWNGFLQHIPFRKVTFHDFCSSTPDRGPAGFEPCLGTRSLTYALGLGAHEPFATLSPLFSGHPRNATVRLSTLPFLPLNSNSISAVNVVLLIGSAGTK